MIAFMKIQKSEIVLPTKLMVEVDFEAINSSAFSTATEQSLCTSAATGSLLTMPRAIFAETPLTGPTSVSNFTLASLTNS